ncbi:MAG TPA: hypothetical protein DEP42_05575, partial [Ruminococcaceae bacterium]|nr:hypothetical protein [Oscillospiraceae bacterium]
FYIDIFKTYLDTDVNIELSKELRLDWLRYQNVSDKIIKDVKIQYEWARKFLDLEYTPRRPNI